MSFDVNLGFKVTTDGLNEVISNIDKLTTAVGKFNKAEIDSARLSAANAKAAEAKEKANKAAAQALQAEIVLTDKNNDLQDKAAKKAQATAVAQSNVAQATSVSTNALDRQKDVLAYMTEGFSRGQSSTLAYAKASGLAADQLRELGQVLQTQRKLIGGDPFDKSTSGLLSLQTQYKETQVAISQYNAQTGLTKQQTRELSRDYERLTTQMLSQGRSMGDITSALDQHTQKYIAVATELNRLTNAEKAHERAQRDSSNAIRAVSKEEEKMIGIMNSLNNQTNMNASFSEKAAIAEANYARNLRLAGVSAEDATKRLSTYRQQQVLVAAEEEKRQAKFLQRGLQPQIGDTVVSLAGGQNPLTVLLQQGDQIRGLIAQSGLQGEALAASMRAAFTGTVESIKMTAVAMSSVLGGAIVGMGNMFVKLGASILVPTQSLSDVRNRMLALNGLMGETPTIVRVFDGAIKGLSIVAGLAAAAFIALGAAVAIAFVSASKDQDEFSKALIRTGGSLGMTKESASAFANSFSAVGVSSAKATTLLTAFIKESGFTRSELAAIIPVAVQMQETFGDSIDNIVKDFAKFKKDPVEALYALAKATGDVSIQTIRFVEEQSKMGNSVAASQAAINEAVRVNKAAVEQMKSDYTSLGAVLNATGRFFSNLWNDIKSLSSSMIEKGTVAAQIAKLQEDIKIGENIGAGLFGKGLAAQKEELRLLQEKQLVLAKATTRQQEATVAASRGASVAEDLAKSYSAIKTPLEKYTELTAKYSQQLKDAPDDKSRAQALRLIADAQKNYNEALDKANKPSKEARAAMKQAIKDEEVYGNLIAKSVNFTETYSEEVQALNRYAAKTKLTQDKYNQAYFALLEKQPYFIALKKDEADGIKAVSDAIKLENQLLGKAEDLGKDYYDQLVKIGLAHATGTFSPARIEAMIQRLNEATPAAKALSKA